MSNRLFRLIPTMVSLLLLVAVPTQASPIKFADVMNVMGDLQKGSQIEQLRLRAIAQEPGQEPSSAASKSLAGPTAPAIDTDVQPVAPTLIAGAEAAPQQPQGEVQVFEQDNVDGTICDCGEIPAVGGGFPKWPFLFLALIPLFFIHHHHKPPPENTPTPTPPPQVPEPASLLLFGSGIVALTAGARRRYAKMRATKQAAAMTEV